MDERSSEDKGVKGGALVGLSEPYLGCGWKKRSIRCAVRSDLIISTTAEGPASEWKTVLKKVNL